jgi:hypothetical protein
LVLEQADRQEYQQIKQMVSKRLIDLRHMFQVEFFVGEHFKSSVWK